MIPNLRCTAVVLLSLSLALPAFAQEQRSVRRGRTATASATEQNDCLFTNLQVFASDMKTSDNDTVTKTSSLTVSVDQFDLCVGTQIFSAFTTVPLASKAFTIQRDLSKAKLVADVSLVDLVTGGTVPSSLHLVWKDTGDGEAHFVSNTTQAPGTLSRNRSNTILALNAQVTGSVTLPGGTLTLFQGQLSNEKQGTFVVSRPGGPPSPRPPGAPVTTETKRAYFATAQFGSQNGCIVDGVFVNALTRPPDAPPSPDATQMLTLSIERFDACTFTPILSASTQVPLPNGALTIAKNLANGALVLTVPVLNFIDNTTVPVSIQLAWQASDTTSRDTTRDQFDTGSTTVINTSKGKSVTATLSGTISTPYGAFGPGVTAVAELGNQVSGSITVIH